MSAHSTSESPRDAAAGDVLRMVVVARRRVRTVATLRLIAVTAPAALTVGAALVLAGWAPAETPRVLSVLGAVAAAAWAAAHTPPITAVARMLDTRLGLRDRVAAAVQLQATDGPIAALVARDAAARLASVRITAVFPLALGREHAVAIAMAVASVAWLSSSSVVSGPSSPAGSAASDVAGNDGGARTARSSATATGGGPTSAPAVTPQLSESRPQARPGGVTREALAPAATTTGVPPQPPPSTAAAPASSVNTNGPGGQGATAPAATAATSRTGSGGAAAGATARGGLTAGAGGASPGSALAAAAAGDPATAAVTLSYRTARAGAEAALARDVIPPDYRDHVRAYFRALPSSQTGAGGTR